MADRDYVAEAYKKLKVADTFFDFYGGTCKEEASELYVSAANAFKLAKKWSQAAEMFERVSQLQCAIGNKLEEAFHYIEAGNCYRKEDPDAAVSSILQGIEMYTDMEMWIVAAKHHITVAELYETELSDMEKSLHHYEKAADYYKVEGNSSANKILLKVAELSARLEKYGEAANLYEEVAKSRMNQVQLKYTVKDHFFRASICHLCMDTVNGQIAVKKYEEIFPTFAESTECKLVKTER